MANRSCTLFLVSSEVIGRQSWKADGAVFTDEHEIGALRKEIAMIGAGLSAVEYGGRMEQQAWSVSKEPQFVVLEKFNETERWLVDIARESDAHRTEFGFVPHTVFREHALREGLYVLVKRCDSGDEYVGHLLFNAKHPRAKVLQIFALPSSRGEGVASRLVGHLKKVLAGHGFSSIYARVAEDLVASNRFWEKQGFYVQSMVLGGKRLGEKYLFDAFKLIPRNCSVFLSLVPIIRLGCCLLLQATSLFFFLI